MTSIDLTGPDCQPLLLPTRSANSPIRLTGIRRLLLAACLVLPVWMGFSSTALATTRLSTAGSEIAAHPHVYFIFWGSWSELKPAGRLQTNSLRALLGELSNSSWANTLTQYWGPSGEGPGGETTYNFISKEIALSSWVDKSVTTATISSVSDIEAEIGRAIHENSAYGWPKTPTANDQFVVVPSPFSHYSSQFEATYPACGWHSHGSQAGIGSITYALLNSGMQGAAPAYQGCDITYVAAHEYAEAATEPMFAVWDLNGWNDRILSQEGEIADICGEYEPTYTPAGRRIPKLWDNSANTCSAGNPAPPQNPPQLVTTAPTEVTETKATLRAAPVLNGLKVESYWFEWGEFSGFYGHRTSSEYGGNLAFGAQAAITGLQPGRTYHFRFVAQGPGFGGATLYGPDGQFVTP
jgi:hypothetical protein